MEYRVMMADYPTLRLFIIFYGWLQRAVSRLLGASDSDYSATLV
jgi:hypothetical protein